MKNKSSFFKRKRAERRYKRLYLLVCEGAVTEPAYFYQLNALYPDLIINIECLKRQDSAPSSLLKSATEAQSKLRRGDEIWIVLDIDNWTPKQFDELEKWKNLKGNRYVAVSKPCFEIWLVFHDRNPNDCSKKACRAYFKENIAHGNKGIRRNWLTPKKVTDAVERAKMRDSNENGIIPLSPTSRVYRLIENIEKYYNV